ncbi:PREDICTED: protein transport protein Sec24A [Propithecus coquereli]|uniref:protein transport protein Sec24A n=1 Tax=Propithecus coquereli TaxID=379532 RepID=UPI00063F6F24|nr:PREDICTED: protein transport protein Sec24A [Propithecus coquereli]
MSQPGIPASGGAPTDLQAQNGAASASGSPYTNGPVQNALMSSQVSVSQGYNFQLPGSYPHLIPAKTLNPASGQSNYGGSQGSGQTLNRPPVASNPVTPLLHSGPVPQMPLPASQNPAATPMPSGSFLPGANPPPPSNWQYNYPSTGSQTNHFPRASSQPPVSGNTSFTTNHPYVSSGDPSLQNSFLKSATPQLANKNPKMSRSVGYSYPSLPPGYQNTTPPSAIGMPPSSLNYASGPQAFTPTPLGANHLTASMGGLSLHPEGLRVVNLLQERSMLPSTPLQPLVPNLHEDIQKLNCNPEYFENKEIHLTPSTDFYKKLALDCSGQQVAVDLFLLSGQYSDLASLGCVSRYSAGSVYYYPSYHHQHNPVQVQKLQKELHRYLTRKIGFEAVMRIRLPGNTRTKIGFITFDSTIHFYSLQEGLSQPQMLIVSDIEDVFIPMPENLLVNLNESKELVQDLLKTLPQMFTKTLETQSALGPALQAAFKLMSPTGGRMSVFQTQLPTLGVGALKPREEPNQRSSAKLRPPQPPVYLFVFDVSHNAVETGYLNSVCQSERRIRVHTLCLPVVSTLNEVFLGADVQAISGLLANMGLSIHTFHGNFFVRSTDLLSLPNVNPDAGYAVQMAVEESLTDTQLVSFQSALLYTSSKVQKSFQTGTNARLDERIFAMCQVKNQPLVYLMLTTHPRLYRVDNLSDEFISSTKCSQRKPLKVAICTVNVIVVIRVKQEPCDKSTVHFTIPFYLKFFCLLFLRDESPMKANFLQNMVEDRTESALSYYEFLLHIQQQVNK